jgi:type II secretory pathway component PulK
VNRCANRHRGSVVVIVLWTIAVAAIIVSSLQLFAYRQATIGRETLEPMGRTRGR